MFGKPLQILLDSLGVSAMKQVGALHRRHKDVFLYGLSHAHGDVARSCLASRLCSRNQDSNVRSIAKRFVIHFFHLEKIVPG